MTESDEKLAAELDREFKKLPELRAPPGHRWLSTFAMLVTLAGMGFADVAGLQPALAQATAAFHQLLAAGGGMVKPLIEFVGSLLANVPMYLWCLIAVGAALSWVASLGLGIVCYQLIRTRKHKHS